MSESNLYNPESYYEDIKPVFHSDEGSRTFSNFKTNTSVKSSFTQSDYNYFRGNRSSTRRSILTYCQEAYDKVGIIQNVINLMSDFGSKGIKVSHPDPKIDKFSKKWFRKVQGVERSERFLSSLYKNGATVIYRKFGRASNSRTSKYIPIEYVYLNPASIKIKDEELGYIPEKIEYQITYSSKISRMLDDSSGDSKIPSFLKDYISQTKTLPSNRVKVYNYRKDDWAFWGWPITYPLLDDLKVLEKLKLSDLAALDGAISQVRLWTVGKITNDKNTTFLPSKKLLQQVQSIIENGVGGGSMDIVMGPEVSFTESQTKVHEFLGEEKYRPTLDSLYDGLGIPSPLRSSQSGNNNPVSLKTLIERLNYGRNAVVDFWTEELMGIYKALGFETDELPIIEFDYLVLTDEVNEKKLLLDMIDRDIIDIETVHEKMNINSKISKRRLKGEVTERGNERPSKAGPYHNAHIEDSVKHELLRDGMVSPKEIGIDIDVDPQEFEKRRSNLNNNSDTKKDAGRPPNVTETKKRDKKRGTESVAMDIWASKAQKKISSIYTPIALKVYNKKNVRSLSTQETINLEEAKASILLGLEPFSEVNEEAIYNSIQKRTSVEGVRELWQSIENDLGELTIDEKRKLVNIYYGEIHE